MRVFVPVVLTFNYSSVSERYMQQQLQVIVLKCASCGAKLEVTQNMNRFACGYCGIEQMVERRGGVVALKPVIDAIARVQTGTDKTAAELALRRLKEELDGILYKQNEVAYYAKSQIARLKKIGSSFIGFGILLGFLIWVGWWFICIFAFNQDRGTMLGLWMGLAATIVVAPLGMFLANKKVTPIREQAERDLSRLEEQAKNIRRQISKQRAIANS